MDRFNPKDLNKVNNRNGSLISGKKKDEQQQSDNGISFVEVTENMISQGLQQEPESLPGLIFIHANFLFLSFLSLSFSLAFSHRISSFMYVNTHRSM